jgi:hypothetical protein
VIFPPEQALQSFLWGFKTISNAPQIALLD